MELEIKVGYACNNNCVFCLNNDKKHKKSFLLNEIVGHIKAAARQECVKLIISGGEPFISPDFFRIVRCAQDEGIKNIEVQTNGRMLCYERLLKELREFGAIKWKFLVSLHFSRRRLYEKYCQTDGFDQVIAGLKNLIQYNYPVTINTALMKQNLNLLGGIASLIKPLGARKQNFRMLDGHNLANDYHAFVPRMSQAVKQLEKVIKEYGVDLDFSIYEIPACILGKALIRYRTPQNNHNRWHLVAGNKTLASEEIQRRQFLFSQCCNDCAYRSTCKGVRREYGQIYGLSELKPIKMGSAIPRN